MMDLFRLCFSVVMPLAFGLTACKEQRYVSTAELTAFVANEENGLSKKIESNNTLIEVTYKPNDLIIAQEVDGSDYTLKEIDSIRNKLGDFYYFNIQLSRNGQEIINSYAGNPLKLNMAVDYLTNKIGADLKLVHDRDTIPVEDFIHIRTFNAAKASVILVAFKPLAEWQNGHLTVLYNDNFFNTGLNRFDFDLNDIQSIPSLNLNPKAL